MATPNPVEYAEQQLGVHDVYHSAGALAAKAQQQHEEMARLGDLIRRKREQIADQEAQLVIDERGKNAEMSATAFTEHMKVAIRTDNVLALLRAELLDLQRDHDWAESQERGFRGSMEVEVGRLHELGGLLLFYAVAKIGPVLERAVTPQVNTSGVSTSQ